MQWYTNINTCNDPEFYNAAVDRDWDTETKYMPVFAFSCPCGTVWRESSFRLLSNWNVSRLVIITIVQLQSSLKETDPQTIECMPVSVTTRPRRHQMFSFIIKISILQSYSLWYQEVQLKSVLLPTQVSYRSVKKHVRKFMNLTGFTSSWPP